MKNLWHWFVQVLFTITLLFVSYCFLAAVLPIDIVTFNNRPLKVLNENKQVKRGDYVLLEADFCKHFPIEAEIETHLEDGVVWDLPSSKTNAETGCQKVVMKVRIPESIPAEASVRIDRRLNYRISPFTVREEVIYSEYFTIIE